VWGSYSIFLLAAFVIIRSMHDLFSPLVKVYWAGGPGYIPFTICHPYTSHISISHGALAFVCVSMLCLTSLTSSTVEDASPIRVFQSPQITVVSVFGKQPTVSSTKLRATSSSIPLFCRHEVGGKYTFPTHNFSPPCICRLIPYVY
jgi:hypothetical protein